MGKKGGGGKGTVKRANPGGLTGPAAKKAKKHLNRVLGDKGVALRRLATQRKRLSRALEKAGAKDFAKRLEIHLDAVKVYNPSELDRSDGDDVVEFAAAERLSHLRAACNGGVPLPEPTETIRALRSPYVVGMLAAGKDWLPEARASLSRWSDDVSAPLAYSRALLAFLVPAFAEGGVGEADGKEADKEAVGEQDSDAEATTGDAGEEDDEFNTPEAVAAAEAMADALGTNPYIGALLAILDDVTVAVEPADLAGAARARENPGYQGSVEEALAYIADAGICWVD
eukprot:gene5220-10047_t